jgi:hypothetical protein
MAKLSREMRIVAADKIIDRQLHEDIGWRGRGFAFVTNEVE